jgi:acyl carrier protein
MSVRERVLEASALKAKISRTALTEETPISELDVDSLAFMDLVMQIEESEQIILSDAEVGAVLAASTLGEFATVIDLAKRKAESRANFTD